ncbi:hypothetical protein [Pollutibacter soli]|uniref:hypothetical protein n=1 Tax=Pollutibacter soli TaxID=3034157 RepID=UPI0030137D76
MIAKIILSTLAATAVMTLFTNMAAMLLKKNLFVIRILTRLLERKSERVNQKNFFPYWALATIIHYLIGIFFAFVCLYWAPKLLQTTPVFGDWLTCGLILGVVAVVSWITLKKIRDGSRLDAPWKLFYVVIFLGHIVFSFTLYYAYFKFN